MSRSKPKPRPKLKRLSAAALERVAAMFALFSEPVRLGILQELQHSELCVNDLVRLLGVSQAHVSRQLSILHGGGLLTRARKGTQVCYRIADPIVFKLCEEVCGKLARDAKADAAITFGV
jgi:DNA-binding transcriptional ArsR family regulator